MSDSNGTALELTGISKAFGDVRANVDIDLELRAGEIHALVGENGAGKSTLAKIIAGYITPDSGRMALGKAPYRPRTPHDAMERRVGMVYQEPMLVARLTVLENLALALSADALHARFGTRAFASELHERIGRLGFSLPLKARVEDIPAARRQEVEVVKLLLRDPAILILDEPTSLLSPDEQARLFERLDALRNAGESVILVSHKLPEVMAHADRVSVMRKGQMLGTFATTETTSAALAEMLAQGKGSIDAGTELSCAAQGPSEPLLAIRDLRLRPTRKPVTLDVRTGEVLGVLAVAGSGEQELADTVIGARRSEPERILLKGKDVGSSSIRARREMGMRYVGADVDAGSLVGAMSLYENALLGVTDAPELARPCHLDKTAAQLRAQGLVDAFDIDTPGCDVAVGQLSGGNRQKLVVARETAESALLVVAVEPAKGLDIGSAAILARRLRQVARRGGAVLLAGYDLGQICEIADRIAVLYDGELVAVVPREEADPDTLVNLMMGGKADGSMHIAES